VRQHEGRLPEVGDDVRHRHRLARPGDAEERLIFVTAAQAGVQLANRAWLITRRRRGVPELKWHTRET